MKVAERILVLERKIWRIESLLWYVAGVLSIKLGSEFLPPVAKLGFGLW